MNADFSQRIAKLLKESYSKDSCPMLLPSGRSGSPKQNHSKDLINLLKEIMFPRHWNGARISQTPDKVKKLAALLKKGICFYQGISQKAAEKIVKRLLKNLPSVRELLKKDIEAAYGGDPAADSYTEIIRDYPGFAVIQVQRAAHELYLLGARIFARSLTEYAHTLTGIDIHPGAVIGEYFFIDHGTGVVIGETVTIGKRVRIYQGVTLGALSLPAEAVDSFRSKKRHPTINDNVIIYANATILGGETVIGANSVIGGNVFIAKSVAPNTIVLQKGNKLTLSRKKKS